MLSRFFGSQIHSRIHLFLLCALASSIVVSKFVMSLCMILLVLNLLLEADFSSYWKNFKSHRLFLWVVVLFCLHVVSLAWSQNLDYGFHDVKVKLPLLIIPMVLTAKPVPGKSQLKWILGIFLATVLFVTLFNFMAYEQVFGTRNYDDIRGMSLFDSHVRLSLMVVMGIVITVQLYRWRILPVFLMMAIVVWLHFYTYFSQVLSGVMVLAAIYVMYGFYWLYNRSRILAYSGLIVVIAALTASLIWLMSPITYDKSLYTPEALGDTKTSEGNPYTHNPTEVCPETGKPIDIYICHPELRREWSKVSNIPYDTGRDVKGQLIFRTLTRYMASMDLKKDAEGFQKLTIKDIRAIEQGQTSVYHRGVWRGSTVSDIS